MCLDELPFAWATASPARSPVRPRWLAGSRRSSTTHAGSSSTAASFTRARRHARQLHPGPARSPGPASQLLDQLAGSTAPGMPKRPPVSSRSTITAPGQLAGLLVAPRPMYGHATSSQPANRCSTGQLHSIAGASFSGPPARLPGGQQLTRPASPGLDAGLVPHTWHARQLPGHSSTCSTRQLRPRASVIEELCRQASTPGPASRRARPRPRCGASHARQLRRRARCVLD